MGCDARHSTIRGTMSPWRRSDVDVPARLWVIAVMSEALRTWLGDQVRSRVIGPGVAAREGEQARDDEAGWFPVDAPIRRVHADASMFVGGLRALLLQSLHPRAMAGVAQHSDYRSDPWGRLQRTAEFLAATTYGSALRAQQAIEVVQRVHAHVVGVTDDGEEYAANDPHLLGWVHVAELDSFLVAHDRFGEQPLQGPERDEYVANSAVIARALGVIDPPVTERELRDELRAFRPELRGTRAARDAARYLLLQPPLPPAGRAAYGLIAGGAVSLMPAWTRWPLRLPWLPVTEATLGRAAGDAVTKALRWAIVPTTT